MMQLNHTWYIAEEEFTVDKNKHFEGILTTGNGYMSVRGSLEEGLFNDPQDEDYLRMPANVTLEKARAGKSKWGTYLPGIMGPHPTLKEEMINLPWFIGIHLWFEDEKLDMEASCILDYSRYLYFKDGTIHRKFTWKTKTGAEIDLYFKRFLSMNQKNISLQSVSLKVKKGSGILKIETGLDANVRTNGFNHFKGVHTKVEGDDIILEVETNGNNQVVEASHVKSPQIKEWEIQTCKDKIFYQSETELYSGDEFELLKMTVVTSDRDLDLGNFNYSPLKKALSIIKETRDYEWHWFYEKHALIWEQKWEFADVKIEGDDFSQLAMRFSIYHLLRSNVEDDPRVAICAKGFAGDAYFGRFFWDTEMYLLPFFIYTNPKAAKNLVMFRYNTLKGAQENAKNYGYKGARYPWESSISGLEQCPSWQYADHEIHITADVVYGLWHYYTATKDMEFLMNYGIEMMIETSRYWIDRVDWDQSKETCHLLGVMGPDEYLPFTRNNAFTNRMVKFNLRKTVDLLRDLEITNQEQYEKIINKMKLRTDEVEQFDKVEKLLRIPYDEDRNLVLQSEDFEDFAEIDFAEIWFDRSKPFGQFISQEQNYRTKSLKQADVLALMFLFPQEFSLKEMEIAYDYYEPITTHDSSLSPSIHSIMGTWLGRHKEAEYFFKKSASIDIDLKKAGAEEGIHIANAGGNWLMVLQGFAGFKSSMESEYFELNPALPSGWNSLEFTILWVDSPIRVKITKDQIWMLNIGRKAAQVKVKGNTKLLEMNQEYTFAM